MKVNGKNDNELRERREYRRVEVGENILAVLKPSMKKLGLIKDISKGGLSLKYISNIPFCENIDELDLFSYPKHFYISKIPCMAVHDRIDRFLQYDELQIRLCGLKFGRLLPLQKKKLNHLLNYGISMPDQR